MFPVVWSSYHPIKPCLNCTHLSKLIWWYISLLPNERKISISLNKNSWTKICTKTMTNKPNLQLIQYKVNHRTYLTLKRMHNMGLSDSSHCSLCPPNTLDDYIHAIWHCPPIQHFWKEFTDELSLILDCRIPLFPSLCLLGDSSSVTIPNHNMKVIVIALTVAKKTILPNWKSRKKWITMDITLYRTYNNGETDRIH